MGEFGMCQSHVVGRRQDVWEMEIVEGGKLMFQSKEEKLKD